ncbi:hypothetical protein [Miltoncostaea oceani]|uniref:hypothetical protein n=1 Tax=Miltoncostaea oceani TaxID=2843216 RepID=UPI001C3CA971|nr:hypothetical protein [Miltoncostaea oceani]
MTPLVNALVEWAQAWQPERYGPALAALGDMRMAPATTAEVTNVEKIRRRFVARDMCGCLSL